MDDIHTPNEVSIAAEVLLTQLPDAYIAGVKYVDWKKAFKIKGELITDFVLKYGVSPTKENYIDWDRIVFPMLRVNKGPNQKCFKNHYNYYSSKNCPVSASHCCAKCNNSAFDSCPCLLLYSCLPTRRLE